MSDNENTKVHTLEAARLGRILGSAEFRAAQSRFLDAMKQLEQSHVDPASALAEAREVVPQLVRLAQRELQAHGIELAFFLTPRTGPIECFSTFDPQALVKALDATLESIE